MITFLKGATSRKNDLFWLTISERLSILWQGRQSGVTVCDSGSRQQWLHRAAGQEEGKVLPEPMAGTSEKGPCPLTHF